MAQKKARPEALGEVIEARRRALGMTQGELARLVLREDGRPRSPTFVHDLEKGTRCPSPQALAGLARALGMDFYALRASAGQCPEEIADYLAEHPEAAADVAGLFARASKAKFTAWGSLVIK